MPLMRFWPSCTCCGGGGGCDCCTGDDVRAAVTATVTLLSGSLPWDVTGVFTLTSFGAEPGIACGWDFFGFGYFAPGCDYAITFYCSESGSPSDCSRYRCGIAVGQFISSRFCINTTPVAPFGSCDCGPPLSVIFRLSISGTIDANCNVQCGGGIGTTFSAQIEIEISPP